MRIPTVICAEGALAFSMWGAGRMDHLIPTWVIFTVAASLMVLTPFLAFESWRRFLVRGLGLRWVTQLWKGPFADVLPASPDEKALLKHAVWAHRKALLQLTGLVALLLFLAALIIREIVTYQAMEWVHPTLSAEEQESQQAECSMETYRVIGARHVIGWHEYRGECLTARGFNRVPVE